MHDRANFLRKQSLKEVETEASVIADYALQIAAYINRRSCETKIILQAVLPSSDMWQNFWPNK